MQRIVVIAGSIGNHAEDRKPLSLNEDGILVSLFLDGKESVFGGGNSSVS